MYNSSIYLDSEGFIVATTEYEGLTAFYLKNNNIDIEKKFYELKNIYKFETKPSHGVIYVTFFFKDKENNITKYNTEQYIYNDNENTLQKLNPEVICEVSDYKIRYYDQNSNVTFITFNGAGTNKNDLPFAQSYVLKSKWNLISVTQDNGSQYQGLSIEDFYEYINPLVANKKVFVYGSSLGAYCAIYFGGIINATIIAASPRNSAHPSIRDAMFSNLKFNHKDFSEIAATSKEVFVVYDSNIVVDKKFVYEQVMKCYPKPNLLELPNASHAVLKTLLSSNTLKLYISSIVCNCYNQDIAEYIKLKCQ